MMGKLLIFLSFCCLLVLEVCSYAFPANSMMWLSSNETWLQAARLGLMALLVAVLVTNPPRQTILRMFTGFISLGTLIGVAYLTYNNHMNILDTLSLTAAGLTLGIVALEVGTYDIDEVDIIALREAKI